jgi:Ca2+-binding EF-hand superfamily protein
MSRRKKEIEKENLRINELFDENDENKTGKLDKEVFIKVFKNLMKALGQDDNDNENEKIAEEALDRFDLNQNGFIERNEFANLMRFLIEEKGLSINNTYN